MITNLPTTMRAAQWTAKSSGGLAETLTFNAKTPLPSDASTLPENSTLVKVAYMSLNHIDYKIPEGHMVGSTKFAKPPVPGHDFGGTVIASTLSNFKENDRVCGKSNRPVFGALGEYVVIKGKEHIAKVPDSVSLEQAACVGTAGITSHELLYPNVKAGDKVLINGGSGGTGTVQIQMAKILGCHVTAICSGANTKFCKSLGADEYINYERVKRLILELKRKGREGVEYDLIIDNVGPLWNDIHNYNHYYLNKSGLCITIAGFWAQEGPKLDRITHSYFLGGSDYERKGKYLLWHTDSEAYTRILEWMAERKLKMVVEKRYELEEAREAYVELQKGCTRGKIVVKVAGE